MDALTQQIQEELRLIEPLIYNFLGWKGRWNGSVELVEISFEGNGKKRYDCGIEIARRVAETETRWRVLIHEMIHAHSVGLNRLDYSKLIGWEEGPVERLQRTLRPQILNELKVSVDENLFLSLERAWPYNPHVAAVETLRRLTEDGDEGIAAYYRLLVEQPLAERPDYVKTLRDKLPYEAQANFTRQFLLAHGRLCRI